MMRILLILLLLSLAEAAPKLTRSPNSATYRLNVYGDFRCSIALFRDGNPTDGTIQEVRSLDLRIHKWVVNGGVRNLEIVGQCGFGEGCRHAVKDIRKGEGSILISPADSGRCRIEEGAPELVD